ncbi:MAG: M1 family aminopeptidase [Rudaea sp.]|uniref:ABC transporter permease/M1 family aminopeptidase n=1 Tax=Rudaea sp. TaxID=2136325 RepID=UPI0039E59587
MLGKILAFERRLILRSPLFWIVALVFGATAFGMMASDNVSFGGGIGNVHRNAPLVVINLLGALSFLSILLVTIFIAGAALRDFEQNTAELFFTTPMRKRDYLLGRFGSGFLAALGVMLVTALGLWLGSKMPWLDPARLGPTSFGAYLWSFGVLVVPNLLFVAALMFAFATLTRSMLYTYLGAIAFVVLVQIAQSMTANLDARWIGALVDPFGGSALNEATRYWSAQDNNTRLPPLSGWLLINRALWLGASALLMAGAFRLFRTDREGLRLFRRRAKAAPASAPATPSAAIAVPAVRLHSSVGAQWRQFLHQTWFDLRSVLTGAPFLVMLVLGLLVMFVVLEFSGEIWGTQVLPVTSRMDQVLRGGTGLFLTLVLAVYAGELVWRERTLRVAEVTDACAAPNWVPLAAKLVALVGVIAAFMLAGVLFCIGWQLVHGYTNLQPGLYAKIALLAILPFMLTAALFVFLQTVSDNKFFGYLLVVVVLVAQFALPLLGYDHPLYNYGKATPMPLSDMNGYGHFVGPSLTFRAYWAALTAMLLIVAAAFWPRGTGANFGERRRRAMTQLRRGATPLALACLFLAFTGLGAWIFYNTNIRNEYLSEDAGKQRQADYEKTYRPLKDTPQPRIVAVKADVDIHPEDLRVVIRGHYRLENKTSQPIDRFIVALDKRIVVRKLDFAAHGIAKADPRNDLTIYALNEPMAPGAAMDFDFDLEFGERGFSASGPESMIAGNGSFFNSFALPHFGYQEHHQLGDRNDRRKYGLPELPRMAPIDDMAARGNTYLSSDSDWVDFETTVSTSPDQIALAPGYLQREWTAKDASGNERRYFHYKSDTKILDFFSWLSARWAVKKDRWNDVAIEVYYDPQHAYNVDRMIESVKKSLDYYTKHFSPYQFRQLRILEFPNFHGSFAQSFANTVPYSESIGFIADLSDKDAVDYVFYVTAHEVAHQWWAHQVIGANVQGATMLSESLAQYSALMVMEHEYGAGQMRKFLKYELDRYLATRATERVKEMPLALNENQQYIHYNKASVVFYALKDYIGEDALNAVLAAFVKAKAFQQPPYTTSHELLDQLRAGTDPKWNSLIDDLFTKITFFDNRVTEATATRRADGKYDVTLTLHAGKKYTDGVGKETDGRIDQPIDIGVFAKAADGKEANEKVLYLDKREVKNGDSTITVTVNGEPYEAGIDPYNKLVDRSSNDNRKKVTLR